MRAKRIQRLIVEDQKPFGLGGGRPGFYNPKSPCHRISWRKQGVGLDPFGFQFFAGKIHLQMMVKAVYPVTVNQGILKSQTTPVFLLDLFGIMLR